MSTSDFEKLFKKKFTPIWRLQVIVEPMLTIDGVLNSVEEYAARFADKMLDAELLNFEVLYDNVVVAKTSFQNSKQQELTVEIEDTIEFNQHLLEFKMSGKNDNHSYHTENNKDVTWVLKYCFFVEDLPMTMLCYNMTNCLQNHVSYIMGQNQSEAVEIETPIYRWLLKHSDQIIREMKLIANEQDPTL